MTWKDRDFPILRAIVELSDEGNHYIFPEAIAQRANATPETVQLALNALAGEQPAFFQYKAAASFGSHDRRFTVVTEPTGHARRTVGTWPTPENLAKKIIAELHAAAEAEPDEEKRSRLKKTADWFGTTGWSVILGVAGNAVSKGIGL